MVQREPRGDFRPIDGSDPEGFRRCGAGGAGSYADAAPYGEVGGFVGLGQPGSAVHRSISDRPQPENPAVSRVAMRASAASATAAISASSTPTGEPACLRATTISAYLAAPAA